MSVMFPGDSLPTDDSWVDRPLIAAFDVVAIVSSLSMSLYLITARINPRIHRSAAWYTMFITLALFPLLYLTNIGFQFQKNDPPWGLCMFQAASIYAGPPAASTAVLGYMLDVALGLHAAITERKKSRIWDCLMPWLPPFVFVVMFDVSIMVVTTTRTVQFDYARMFCGAGAGSFHARISASVTLFTLVCMFVAEIWIITMLVKNRHKYDSGNRGLQISMAVRFGLFTILVLFAGMLAAFIIPMNKDAGAVWNVFLVTVPFIAGLAFGTHRDLLRTWVCWILRRPYSSEVEYIDLQTSEK